MLFLDLSFDIVVDAFDFYYNQRHKQKSNIEF